MHLNLDGIFLLIHYWPIKLGGTITSVGRYAKKYSLKTEVVLADTEFSAYYDYAVNNRFKNSTEDPTQLWVPPGMAGTGFGYAGPIQYARTSR